MVVTVISTAGLFASIERVCARARVRVIPCHAIREIYNSHRNNADIYTYMYTYMYSYVFFDVQCRLFM
jgi:hypothetical protein